MPDGANRRILVVDDEIIIARALESTLRHHGYDVEVASSGDEAIKMVACESYDLVLMDIGLGDGVDGVEAARTILREAWLPLIFHSAHSDPDTINRFSDIRHSGIVVKSADDQILLEAIGTALAQSALASDRLLRRAFDSIQDGMAVLDTELRIVRVNKWIIQRHGQPNEIIGRRCYEVYHGRSSPCSWCPIPETREHGVASQAEIRLRNCNGGHYWGQLTTHPVSDEAGEIVGYIEHIKDVSDRVEAEQERHWAQTQYRALLDTIPDTVLAHDERGIITFANEGSVELLGIKPADLVGTEVSAFVPPEEVPAMAERKRRRLAGETATFRYRIELLRADGQRVPADVSSKPISNSGAFGTNLEILRDRSDSERAEAELQRLATERDLLLQEGRHRMKNDLNLIRSMLSLQAGKASEQAVARTLSEAADRVAVMSDVYEALSADHGVDFDSQQLLSRFVERLAASVIPELVEIECDVEQFSLDARRAVAVGTALNELVTNAVKYAFDGVANPRISIRVRQDAEGVVTVVVSDNGAGIELDQDRHVSFGLGLTLVQAIAEQHNGSLQISSADGTVVEVTLTS